MELRLRLLISRLCSFCTRAHKLVAAVFVVSVLVHTAQGDNASVSTLHCSEAGSLKHTKPGGSRCCPPRAPREETSAGGNWRGWRRSQGCGGFQNTISWEGSSTDNASLALVSVPWMGSRPELVVKAVPMLASYSGFAAPPCLQPPWQIHSPDPRWSLHGECFESSGRNPGALCVLESQNVRFGRDLRKLLVWLSWFMR